MNVKSSIFVHWADCKKYVDSPSELSQCYSERIKEFIQVNIDAISHSQDYILPIVYVFVDIGIIEYIKEVIGDSRNTENFLKQIKREEKIISDLKSIVSECRKSIVTANKNFTRSCKYIALTYPKFIFIGINEFINLLDRLSNTDKQLIRFIGGNEDLKINNAPSFIEAAVRISRSNIKSIINHEAIVRIDQDVTVYYKGLQILLDAYSGMMQKPFHFFSGDYGKYDKNGKPIKDDPKNDYAVKVHFLIDLHKQKPLSQLKLFLTDLGQLGATQILPSNRNTTELISGAGLITSPLAIRYLPPFMCFNTSVEWIDDHLKRKLFESLGYIFESDLECVMDAKFTKNRYEQKIGEGEIKDSSYFRILLAGCLLHALFTNPTKNVYIKEIRNIIHRKNKIYNIRIHLIKDLEELLIQKYDTVIERWTSDAYVTLPDPNIIFYNWAKWASKDLKFKKSLIDSLVSDAINYLRLIARWNIFIHTIDRV